ncbi:HAD-IA family hydrolase [Colwellia sp. MSW7]|jgi:phosphoglycolate phosphatase|uniref:HAD-IA family hydrolase n=1 Tax=Colwellia maritima TaxID=2912588 RepID=A0ABS9X303_9GAMM|nr:HAD-IA family hydrolase [Colwellia maritima]MCI2284475.1 HAD-IA family hydrolase [Colwellia maritima]
MHSYKLVIFDWDGTLMDSVDRIVSSMRSAAKTVGLAIPANEDVKQIIGLSLDVGLKKLFLNITSEQIDAMLVEYKYQYLEGDNTPTPLFDDAYSLLVALKQKNTLLAVATGKGREGLNRVLKISDTDHFFNTTRCASEMASKPDPQMLHSILTELDIAPHQAIMIGDTSHDLEMAQNAGIDSIGVTFGVHNNQILQQFKPKAVVDSISELHVLLV